MYKRIHMPSPAMIVAVIALSVAMGGAGYAAGKVTSRDVKNNSLTGIDIRQNSLSGKDIRESTLGTVPSAVSADTADSATNATNADNAANLGGTPASGYAKRLFAPISYTTAVPTKLAGTDGITTEGESALGFPRIRFPQSVGNCAVVATAASGAGTQIVRRSTNAGALLQLAIKDDAGASVRGNFDVIAIC